MKRVRVKPSRGVSALGMLVGIVFLGIGVVIVIPIFGPFGVLWTLIAAGITVFHAVNAFSSRGIATEEFVLDDADKTTGVDGQPAFDDTLRRLEQLRIDGLISESEYFTKREQIMSREW